MAKLFNEETLESWKEIDSAQWKEIVNDILNLFFEAAETRTHDLKTYIANQDFDRARSCAHSLKTTFGNVGAEKANLILDRIEKFAEARSSDQLNDLSVEFEAIYNETMKTIVDYQILHLKPKGEEKL